MSNIESCKDRQDNELEVLKSIFGDELRDLRKNKTKKKWQPLDISITLTPQKGMSGPAEIYAQIDLHITCGEKYPDVVPTMELKNSQGLSNQQVEVLYTELTRLAYQLSGEVMIFELAQHVQKYLHEHNKPSYSSFYEEMISRHQEKKQYEMQEKQLKENKERQVLQDEIQKRQDALKAEMRNFARKYFGSDVASQTLPSSPQERVRTYSRRRYTSTSESSEGSLCEHRGTKLLHFDNSKGERQIHRGKCLGHNNKGSIVYAGLDMTSGELVVVTEWTLKYGTHKEKQEKRDIADLQYAMKQISSLEQELNHLHKLHHPNLVHYLNMKYVQDNNNIVIYILQEFVVGTSCAFFLMENISIDIDILRHLASGILSALQYLHENNVVHRDLRDTSVFIDHIGGIKLADYSLDKRLADIYRTSSLAKVEHDIPTIQGRGGKKTDIYRFGILMLSLLKGTIVSGNDIDLTIILQPHLKDFISKCLVNDERLRWSAEQLLQHSFIKTPLDHSLSRLKLKTNNEQKNDEPEKPDSDIELHLPTLGGQSRIRNEFEILKWLGKGAYGDVLKVKNKLDRGVYAIKRIELNPKKRLLNRKITREVKLLSRVNHENVVRYYNSWIESATIDDSLQDNESILQLTTSSININSDQTKLDTVNHLGSDEKLAPPINDVEWSVSYESVASAANTADSESNNSDASSESDSDDDSSFVVTTFRRIDSSDSIEFKEDISQASPDNANDHEKSNVNTLNSSGGKEIQFMYIQMEFCEKSTLRTAIDNGLYEDEERVWRLFREIVEGLAHIHQQGMIHRDLKPVNIFLDSNDHVKIGDFGLATSNILSSLAQTVDNDKETDKLDKDASYDVDELRSLTGEVGTALYAAPELSAKTAKAIYNQKVDIYSLGIILFEMCYKPLSTGMERVKVLLNLRSKDIILPSDISESNMPHQVHIFRWLLNHDPSQRPTAQELLSSEYLPPPQLEETELQEMVRHTLSNTQSKAYKYLVASCFMQEVTAAEDITYDMNLTAREIANLISSKRLYLQENVKAKVIEIFQKHGGICLNTPLLMPKSSQHNNFTDACVQLMTRTGSIVSIPHDLRVPFARYVVWNKIPYVRRYTIERVFREKKVRGFHPRELYECAFDIISPMASNLMAEAELIFIAWEIFNEIPHLRERNFTIRLNHTLLLQAVLMYCGIEHEKYQDIYSILCDARDGKCTKFQVQTHLISLCLTDQAMETLFNLFETENSIAKIRGILKTITKRKGDAAALAKEALHDIEVVIANIEALGVKWPVMIVPLLVYKIQQYSGVIYQITCELKHRRKGGQDVIAAGGRYDKMLMSFRQILERTEMTNKETKQYGVGISISLDKLVCAVEEMSESICRENKFGIDVAVYCDGSPRREKEMVDVLRELWSIGIRTTILDTNTVEEVLEYCQEHSISQIILLKNNEKSYLRVQTWEKDRFQERKIGIQEIADFLQRQTENPLPILNRSEHRSHKLHQHYKLHRSHKLHKNEAEEEKAEIARLSLFVGAIAIGDLVKSTLGPKGMDKILVAHGRSAGQVQVTNDGATILKSVGVDNPAAKILVDMSRVQDDEVGDGTTSVTVLAAELLKEAEKLIEQKIHPQTIISGWRNATNVAREALKNAAADNSADSERFREDLLNIARTTLSSKILSQHKEHFSKLAVDAVLRLKGSGNLSAIQVIKKRGATLLDSFLDDGFLLDKKPGLHQPQRITDAQILIANTPMDTDKIKVFGSRVRVDSMAKIAELEVAEKEKMKDKVDKIIKHGCNVFINRQLIYNYPEQLFADAGIMAIEHADFDGIERLALVTGGEIVSTFDHPELVKLGKCELIEQVMIGEDTLLRFSGVALGEACTVIIRGATQQILDEAERSLHDALCVLAATVRESRIVYGGGCGEMVMACAVMKAAAATPGKEAVAMEAFAKALQQLPTVIADNAGYDSAQLVSELRAAHNSGANTMGLDMETGRIGCMKRLGITESWVVKRQVLLSAAEAAEMILRVDDILRAAPRKRVKDRGRC